MKRKKEHNNPLAYKIGALLIIIGIILVARKILWNKFTLNTEKEAIEEYYMLNSNDETTEGIEFTDQKPSSKKNFNYIAVLRIPKIKLEKGLVHPNSPYNNINYNIEILDSSDMPDKDKGNFILAAHSGNSSVSYFKNLDKLSLNDEVIVNYNDIVYKYKITSIYDIKKTGTAKIVRDKNKNTLTLITCRQKTNNQIVIICELIK